MLVGSNRDIQYSSVRYSTIEDWNKRKRSSIKLSKIKEDSLKDDAKYTKIKDWDKTDRPREKLLTKGAHSLTNAELLGIIINSGIENMTAVDIARNLLIRNENDLNKLAKLSVKDLQKFMGIGEVKAITISSALELAKRKNFEKDQERPIIKCSLHAYKIMTAELLDKITEEFWIILLSSSHKYISKHKISSGGLSSTIVDPKVVFKKSIEENASNIILVHNHPSGIVTPSDLDKNITNKLVEGAKILEIKVVDHIIFSNFYYFSFADEGIL